MKLPSGKIPIDLLKEVVFKNLGAKREEVVLGPSVGVDGAVVNVGDKAILISMDPITGAIERVGWLAVNVNANDVATFGVKPSFMLSCILLPEKADRSHVENISIQMDRAAKELDIAIVGGHCEVTPGLTHPIVVGCVMGITEKGNYVTAGEAESGDQLILTKSAGIEGTAILAIDKEKLLKRKIGQKTLQSAKEFFSQISVVKEALAAFNAGGVHAMHDPTEGGIIGGVVEMAEASKLGVEIFEKEIPVRPETEEICEAFRIDPLQLVSSGALLIAANPDNTEKILRALKKIKIQASVIGSFTENTHNRTLFRKNGKRQKLPTAISDHLWLALAKRW
ncbi:MAG: AIR synthase family protein [Candidatus Bathyarchaeia archaeon]